MIFEIADAFSCQVCGGGTTICNNANDDGKATECQIPGADSCLYGSGTIAGQTVYLRSCSVGTGN